MCYRLTNTHTSVLGEIPKYFSWLSDVIVEFWPICSGGQVNPRPKQYTVVKWQLKEVLSDEHKKPFQLSGSGW